jgi:hypothetical protein
MPAGERLYRAVAIMVVAALTAATAILVAAIALISRQPASEPPEHDQG